MNAPVFVDTSAWYAVADAGDAWHAQAVHFTVLGFTLCQA